MEPDLPNLRWGTTELYPDRAHAVLPGSAVSLCTQDGSTQLIMAEIAEYRRSRLRVCPECAIAAVGRLYPAWPSPRPRPRTASSAVNLAAG